MSATDQRPDEASTLVSGDAVLLEVPAAGLGLRAGAALIDLVAEVVLMVGLFKLLEAAPRMSGTNGSTATLVVLVGCWVAWPVAWETLTGRTPGKWLLGTRVVRLDGGPIRFRQALARGLLGFVEIWSLSGIPALVTALCSRRGQRLGDHVAGTCVVRDRVRSHTPDQRPALQVSPELSAWSRTADLGRLPAPLLVAARQFLARRELFTPPARDQQARGLATELVAQIRPMPPVAPAEEVVAAICEEHRRRAAERLQADEQVRERLFGLQTR